MPPARAVAMMWCNIALPGHHIEIKIGAGKASKVGEVTIKDARRTAA